MTFRTYLCNVIRINKHGQQRTQGFSTQYRTLCKVSFIYRQNENLNNNNQNDTDLAQQYSANFCSCFNVIFTM